MLYVGLAIEQQADDLSSALKAGEGQSCVSVGLDLSVDVGAHIQQQLHRWHVTIHSRQHERRNPQLTASPNEKVNIQEQTIKIQYELP